MSRHLEYPLSPGASIGLVTPSRGVEQLSARVNSLKSSAIRDLLALTSRNDVISLAGGLPATELIPAQRIRDAALSALEEPAAVQYGETSGLRGLRSIIATRETSAIGRSIATDNVVVTHGSQQALTLVTQALVDPGDIVVVDEPAYTGALQVFSIAGAQTVAIPTTPTGLDTVELERRLDAGLRPKMVHTVSNFHNPRGVTMDTASRRHLTQLAEHFGFWILEDDPYGEIWFESPPPAPIATYSDRVVRLGSASKILAPALRVGWLVASTSVTTAVELLKQGADLCGSALTHSIAAAMLDDSEWLDSHLDVLRSEYGRRALAMTDALTAAFGDRMQVSRPSGGMFVWAEFSDGTNTTDLLARALDHGVGFVPGSAFTHSPRYAGSLRLCFASSPAPVLTDAIGRLRAATSAPQR